MRREIGFYSIRFGVKKSRPNFGRNRDEKARFLLIDSETGEVTFSFKAGNVSGYAKMDVNSRALAVSSDEGLRIHGRDSGEILQTVDRCDLKCVAMSENYLISLDVNNKAKVFRPDLKDGQFRVSRVVERLIDGPIGYFKLDKEADKAEESTFSTSKMEKL